MLRITHKLPLSFRAKLDRPIADDPIQSRNLLSVSGGEKAEFHQWEGRFELKAVVGVKARPVRACPELGEDAASTPPSATGFSREQEIHTPTGNGFV